MEWVRNVSISEVSKEQILQLSWVPCQCCFLCVLCFPGVGVVISVWKSGHPALGTSMGRKTCSKYIFQPALRFAVLAAYYWMSAGTCVSWRAENTTSLLNYGWVWVFLPTLYLSWIESAPLTLEKDRFVKANNVTIWNAVMAWNVI